MAEFVKTSSTTEIKGSQTVNDFKYDATINLKGDNSVAKFQVNISRVKKEGGAVYYGLINKPENSDNLSITVPYGEKSSVIAGHVDVVDSIIASINS
ncbi:MAG: hypothetical protein LKI39_02725 [Bacteroides sp.]|jgi:hypothetical protein|nr:hypothetical protein [Bacteroides sp.]